jgi:rubredoxin
MPSDTRECPMCGSDMHRVEHERIETVPGTHEAHSRLVREWTCPECDYFEEETGNGEES